MGRWWRYKWITFHPSLTITAIKALIMCPQRLKEAGLLASTGSTGDSYDDAMAESINGLYKTEVITVRAGKNGQKWSWPH